MGAVTLVTLSPRRAADGAVQTLRLVANARHHAGFFGQQWLPAIVALPDPELDLGFDGRSFGQGATPQVGQLRIAVEAAPANPASALPTAGWPSLVWKGAACVLRMAAWPATGADPADGDFSAAWPFVVDEAATSADGVLTLTLVDPGQPLRQPGQPMKFGSSGDTLLDGAGAGDLKGQVVPAGWGRLSGVPASLVDRVNNIWLLHARPSSAVSAIYDGGAAFSAGVARADLAALQAAAPAAGAADWCLDAGGLTLVRPWTAPAYPLTADLVAQGPDTAGAIAAALVAARSALSFAAGTVAAFDALYPGPCGLLIDDERSTAGLLDQLLCPLGAFWALDATGQIVLGRLAPALPAVEFGGPALISVERRGLVMPTHRRQLGYNRNDRVHNEGEIATILLAADIAGLGDLATQDKVDWGAQVDGAGKPEDGATRNVNRGAWAAAVAYAAGDVVALGGASYTCQSAHVSAAGNAPPSAQWQLLADAGADGLSIAASRPVMTVAQFADGTAKPGQLPQSVQMIVYAGSTDVTAAATFTLPAQTNCTASNDGGGGFTLTAVSALPASFTVRAAHGGKTIDMAIAVAAPKDGAAASRASVAAGAPSSTGSLVAVGTVDLIVADGATISAHGGMEYRAVDDGLGNRTVALAAAISIENVTDAGAPGFGSTSVGSTSLYIHGDGLADVGFVSASHSATNSSGATKQFRAKFWTMKNSGNSSADTTAGEFSGIAEISAA